MWHSGDILPRARGSGCHQVTIKTKRLRPLSQSTPTITLIAHWANGFNDEVIRVITANRPINVRVLQHPNWEPWEETCNTELVFCYTFLKLRMFLEWWAGWLTRTSFVRSNIKVRFYVKVPRRAELTRRPVGAEAAAWWEARGGDVSIQLLTQMGVNLRQQHSGLPLWNVHTALRFLLLLFSLTITSFKLPDSPVPLVPPTPPPHPSPPPPIGLSSLIITSVFLLGPLGLLGGL